MKKITKNQSRRLWKKDFTLTKLLALIVILAAVALIAISRIMTEIEEPREETNSYDDIAFINDPDNVGDNALPCLMEGEKFTHITDKRDNTTYAVTQIGDQCWFAENLAYTGNGCLENDWNSLAPFNACNTHGLNEESIQGTFQDGLSSEMVLYQWGAAMDGSDGTSGDPVQGLCPSGWLVASDAEWTTLTNYVGTNPGTKLKDDTHWDGTNSFGFSALPGGNRNTSGALLNFGSFGLWWSSSPSNSDAWRRHLVGNYSGINSYTDSQAVGYSVRCLLGQ